MTLGDFLKQYRMENNISMETLANQIGISKGYISMLEKNRNPGTGKPIAPSLDVIKRVAAAVHIDTNLLIDKLDDNYKISIQENSSSKSIDIPPGFEPIPRMVKKPLVGSIACGEPILAEENIEDYVDIPENVHCDFCLRCKGQSMIDAGIQEGDIVYIRKQEEVENGEIAAVRIEGEATLKRVHWDAQKQTLMLIPANSNMLPMIYTGEAIDAIHIEGKAVGFTHWF